MKNVDYSKLEKSEKFNPALYHEKDGIWEGGSTSQFSPVMTFKLWEKFSNNFLEVSESMEVNGKRTFGYDELQFVEDSMNLRNMGHYMNVNLRK